MNLWMDIAIPALGFAAGCLAVAIWALWHRKDDKALLKLAERQHAKERSRLSADLASARATGDALQAQVEQYGKDAIAQAKRVDAALRERDEATHLYNGLQTRFDAIRAEIEALKKPARTPRTSRAKPLTTQEEERQ